MIINRLLNSFRKLCETFPDKRTGRNISYAVSDIAMAAFSIFFMQSPSFLAHQRLLASKHGRTNCQTLMGIAKIPSDNHIREMLDPVPPENLFPLFPKLLNVLEEYRGLKSFQRLNGRLLIAFDGTEYHCSQKINCAHCSTRKRRNGKLESYHSLLSATIVAPGHNRVLPLEPCFITPQDGHDKQDCENAAIKRWLQAHGKQYDRFEPVYLGDDLMSRQPICEEIQGVGANFIFVAKPSSHKTMYTYIDRISPSGLTKTIQKPRTYMVHQMRWLNNIPLRDGSDAMNVNWFEITITNRSGKVTYRNSFVTDLPVNKQNIVSLIEAGRARWKIENEHFNTVKNGGYHLQHNFGHGQQNLANLLVTMNLLAFAFHTVCDLIDEVWQQARKAIGPRKHFFQELRLVTKYLIFPNWSILIQTMITGEPPPNLLIR